MDKIDPAVDIIIASLLGALDDSISYLTNVRHGPVSGSS